MRSMPRRSSRRRRSRSGGARRAPSSAACRGSRRVRCRPGGCRTAGRRPRDDRRPWRVPTHGERAALALRRSLELVEPVGTDREHVALLRLVAPDLAWRHARLFARHRAQIDRRAPPAAVRELRQCVREPAGADVVDREDRVRGAERGSMRRSLPARGARSRRCRAGPNRSRGRRCSRRRRCDEAAPPPMPISMPGPPSCTSSGARRYQRLQRRARRACCRRRRRS